MKLQVHENKKTSIKKFSPHFTVPQLCCHFSHLCYIHSLKPILYPSFRKYLNSSWNFTFKVWENPENIIGSYYWKLSFFWHFGIFCKWLLNLLEFSYLFSLLSPRQSAPFEYSFVSENSSNYWLKQSFCGFFVWQSLST